MSSPVSKPAPGSARRRWSKTQQHVIQAMRRRTQGVCVHGLLGTGYLRQQHPPASCATSWNTVAAARLTHPPLLPLRPHPAGLPLWTVRRADLRHRVHGSPQVSGRAATAPRACKNGTSPPQPQSGRRRPGGASPLAWLQHCIKDHARRPCCDHSQLPHLLPILPPGGPLTRAQQRSWLYRVRPSVTHEPFHPLNFPAETLTADFAQGVVTPNQLRWRPFTIPTEPVDFVRGLFSVCGAGRCGTSGGRRGRASPEAPRMAQARCQALVAWPGTDFQAPASQPHQQRPRTSFAPCAAGVHALTPPLRSLDRRPPLAARRPSLALRCTCTPPTPAWRTRAWPTRTGTCSSCRSRVGGGAQGLGLGQAGSCASRTWEAGTCCGGEA